MSEESKTKANDDANLTSTGDIDRKVKEFIEVFSQGAKFTEELLADNQRLRRKVLGLEEKIKILESGGDDQALVALQKKYDQLKATYDELVAKLQEVEEENHDFARRYVEIEEENNNLANLYIASFQLHSTLNFQEVVQIILEIVINLIGAESFAVYVYDEDADAYRPAASEGMDHDALVDVPSDSMIGRSIVKGDVVINESLLGVEGADLGEPLVIVPLAIKEQRVGAILIYKLLQQKTSFAPVDRELFTLLAGHAATAIFSSRLYMESERKLSTMQGFIDLLTK